MPSLPNQLPFLGDILRGPYWPRRIRVVRVQARQGDRALLEAFTLDEHSRLISRIFNAEELGRLQVESPAASLALDGDPAGFNLVAELLNIVQEMVGSYALDRILYGERQRVGAVDTPTRYYIRHRRAYVNNDITFDDAVRLAIVLRADIYYLLDSRGLLRQIGETVKLLDSK